MIVRTTDMDVVVPAVDDPQKNPATEIWFPFRVLKSFSYIPAHQITSQLGPRPASALPMFHAITGCDTVSCLSSVDLVYWMNPSEMTGTLRRASVRQDQLNDED